MSYVWTFTPIEKKDEKLYSLSVRLFWWILAFVLGGGFWAFFFWAGTRLWK